MTDLGPMQPDYRRRMEAAEAELASVTELYEQTVRDLTARDERVKELEAECDKYRAKVDEDFLAQLMDDDLNTVEGRATYAAVRDEAAEMEREHRRVLGERADAAEQRAIEAEAKANDLLYNHGERVKAELDSMQARADAAEAREQALRDRVTELADEWDARAEVREASMRTTLAPIRDGAELAVFDKGANRLRALLSPEPTEQRGKS